MRHALIVSVSLLVFTLGSKSQVPGPPVFGPPAFDIHTTDSTARPSLPQPQFDLNAVPSEARQQLLPLYQQEYARLQELSVVKWQAVGDTVGGLAKMGPALVARPVGPPGLAEASAASAGQYGARYGGVNAALDAQTPAEMYASVNRAMQLLLQIDQIDKEISQVQKAYGLNDALRPPWASLFPSSKQLTPTEVYELLLPAAKQAAQAVQGPTKPKPNRPSRETSQGLAKADCSGCHFVCRPGDPWGQCARVCPPEASSSCSEGKR